MISDRITGKKQLTINFYRELFFKDHVSSKDSDALLAERWWGIGGQDNPLSELNIREAMANAKMSGEEKNLIDELSQMQAKQIQKELLGELDVYIEIDKKKEYPGFQTAKKLFANFRGDETDTIQTNTQMEFLQHYWPWQKNSPQMYNQARNIVLSIKNYETAYVALRELKALVNPKKSRRLSQRLLKVNEILQKHLDDLSNLIMREFSIWIHKQIINHYAKLYACVDAYFQAYSTKSEFVQLAYPIVNDVGFFDTKTSKRHDYFKITIPWGEEDVVFIAQLAQRMRLEARQVIRDILQQCRVKAGLLVATSTLSAPESMITSPPVLEKKSDTPKPIAEVEGVFNPNPVVHIDEPEQPGGVEENQDQPGLPFFARLPQEKIEELEEVEGQPTVRRRA